MHRGIFAALVVVAMLVASWVVPATARAETCVPVPGGTTGVTVEAGGQKVRVPSVTGVAVCIQLPSAPGVAHVEPAPGGASLIIGGSSGTNGYIAVLYSSDGQQNVISVPLPGGGGPGDETCVFSAGAPARADCLAKISTDDPVGPSEPICLSVGTCIDPSGDPYEELKAWVNEICYSINPGLCLA